MRKKQLNGLIEAMQFFKLKQGAIVTLNQKDRIEKKGVIVDVIPCYEWIE